MGCVEVPGEYCQFFAGGRAGGRAGALHSMRQPAEALVGACGSIGGPAALGPEGEAR